MTGDEHYQEAERLIRSSHDLMDQQQTQRANFILARAQVHATLAQAAATVDAAFTHGVGQDTLAPRIVISDDRDGWGYGQ